MRLLDRLAGRENQVLARVELVESAIRWEVAAVLTGRTMSCWGSETILAGFRGAA